MVEAGIVDRIDEELVGRRMRIAGARHRYRAALVRQGSISLVLDRIARVETPEAAVETAPLDHEAVDDAVEDRAVVMAIADIGEKILHCLGRRRGIQLDDDIAGVGAEQHPRTSALCETRRHGERGQGRYGQKQGNPFHLSLP
jgi:hypothetical protein